MRNKKGFTLVELLAVIAILGILAAVATTAIIGRVKKAKNDAKIQAAKEIINIAESFFVENNLYPDDNGVVKAKNNVESDGFWCRGPNINTSTGLSDSYYCDVTIGKLISDGYLEENATNPSTGEPGFADGYKKSKVRISNMDYGRNNIEQSYCTSPVADCYFTNYYVYVSYKNGSAVCIEEPCVQYLKAHPTTTR